MRKFSHTALPAGFILQPQPPRLLPEFKNKRAETDANVWTRNQQDIPPGPRNQRHSRAECGIRHTALSIEVPS